MSERPLRPAAARVQALLEAAGLNSQVVEFAETTRTAAEAAAQVGCGVGQIAKSLVFRGKTTGRPILIVASGLHRVDEKAVAAILGEKVGKADADFVREKTGYSIGGVAPLGHTVPPVTLIDEALIAFDFIWAAAGTPFAVFRLTPGELQRITAGRVAKIAEQ